MDSKHEMEENQARRENSWGPGQIINVGPLHKTYMSR